FRRVLFRSSELPEVVGEDVGEELDTEGAALLTLALGFGLDGDRLSIHGSFRASGTSCPPFWADRARAAWEPSRLGRRPTPEGFALTARHAVRDPRRRKGGPKDRRRPAEPDRGAQCEGCLGRTFSQESDDESTRAGHSNPDKWRCTSWGEPGASGSFHSDRSHESLRIRPPFARI